MSDTRSFFPLYGPASGTGTGSLYSSVTVAASATHAASAQLGVAGSGFYQMQIANTTTAWAYVQFGAFGSVASSTVATGYPVAPGAVVVVSVQPEVTGADVILGAAPGTATGVIFTRGEGI
jgi:hypothetical protein